MFTLALQKASQNKLITDLTVASDCKKLFQTIKHNYLKAPYYEDVIDFVGELLCCSAGDSFSDFVFETLQKLCAFLGIQTQLIKSSMLIYDRELKAADKLIDICKQRNADQYVNPTGGMDLYSKSEFSEKSIELSFLKFNPKPYPQMSVEQDFHSHMSVIDTLFCAGPEFTKKHIKDYSLI